MIPNLNRYNVTEIFGIFIPVNKGLVEWIQKIFKIKAGLYLTIGDNPEPELCNSESRFDFIKIQGFMCDPLLVLDGIEVMIEKYLNLGFNKLI